MDWIEAKLYTTTQAVETVCAALYAAGIPNVQIEDIAEMKRFLSEGGQWDYVDEDLLASPDGEAAVIFYCDTEHGLADLEAARAAVAELSRLDLGFDPGRLSMETKVVDDADWLDKWKQYYKPFAVGRVVIRPEWEPYTAAENEIVFTIDPGHVFGTGLHQSTQLCIEQLEKAVAPGVTVLDLGCGSGILSVIAMLLGARSALAVDIDSNAVDIAYRNARLNQITTGYEVLSGDVLTDDSLRARVYEQKYDVITANIVADVIIALADFAAGCLRAKDQLSNCGLFITSGIIRERLEDVRRALTAAGFEIVSENFKDDWVCVVGRLI